MSETSTKNLGNNVLMQYEHFTKEKLVDNILLDWMGRCLPRITSDERNDGTHYPEESGIGKPAAHVNCNWCH